MAFTQTLSTHHVLDTMALTSYLEGVLDKRLANPVQHDEELAHLYLRMALQVISGFLSVWTPVLLDLSQVK